MKRRTEPPQDRAGPRAAETTGASSEARLLSLLATLEQCRASLDQVGSAAAGLLSLAMLELRLELHRVTESELKALCDLTAQANQPSLVVKPGQDLPPLRLQLVK